MQWPKIPHNLLSFSKPRSPCAVHQSIYYQLGWNVQCSLWKHSVLTNIFEKFGVSARPFFINGLCNIAFPTLLFTNYLRLYILSCSLNCKATIWNKPCFDKEFWRWKNYLSLGSVLLHSLPYCLFSTCDPCLTISCKAVTWNVFSFISWIFPTQLPANSPQTSARVSPTKREANPFVPLLVVTSNMIFIFNHCWICVRKLPFFYFFILLAQIPINPLVIQIAK